MKEKFLAFDIGASSGRAIVGILENDKIALEEVHRFDNRPVYAGGELFWDILRLLSEVKIGIQLSEKTQGQVHSLAIDTWGCDFGLINKDGRLIGNPAHYRDRKRYERSAQMHKILSEQELFKLSGGPRDRIMSIYQLFALQSENAVEYEKAHKFLMIPDLLNYFLTGEIANEFTNATMSLMCNQTTRQWEQKIISKFGFNKDIFTPLVEAGHKLGAVNGTVCEELGIKSVPVIIPATHDSASAVAGIPITHYEKSWAFISVGTFCISGVETSSPIINDKVISEGFGNEGGVEGKNMLVKNIGAGMWIIQQCREKWMKDAQEKISWDDIVIAANQSAVSNVFIDVDDERFGQVQPDMPGTIANYCRQTGQKIPTTLGEVARCVYESLTMKFKYNLQTIEEITGNKLELLHLVGGGTQNKLLCQWTANVVGTPVIAGPTETTTVGNFIFQLIAGGYLKNVQEGRQLCSNSFETVSYEPRDVGEWSEKYQTYLKVVRQ